MSRSRAEIAQPNLSAARRGSLRPKRESPLLQRPSVNITSADRAGRILIGLAAVVVGAILLSAASSFVAGVLEALLIAAGLDLIVTGALGHCPLYQMLGYTPISLKEQG